MKINRNFDAGWNRKTIYLATTLAIVMQSVSAQTAASADTASAIEPPTARLPPTSR